MFVGGHYHGQSGISCNLIAYDALIDAKDNFEKLIFYSIMNNFDADTIGCVAFGLYGLLYGLLFYFEACSVAGAEVVVVAAAGVIATAAGST